MNAEKIKAMKPALPVIDVKTLLSHLDNSSLGLVEKATRFCVQQCHSEISVEHVLLQMLDDSANPLNQLLQKQGVDPLSWIRHLLTSCQRYRLDRPAKPLFSDHLLDWFSSAVDTAGDESDKVQPADLLASLLKNPSIYRSTGLNDLQQISVAGR